MQIWVVRELVEGNNFNKTQNELDYLPVEISN